jgi:hypothetical protein
MSSLHPPVFVVSIVLCCGCGSPAPVGSASAPTAEAPAVSHEGSDASPAGITQTSSIDEPIPTPPAPAADPPPQSFRPPDERPRHDPQRIAEHGIHLYESRRLKLYTDIEPDEAEPLPPLMDALFDEWQAYFGELPPARDGSDYQLTACVMRDQQPFREAGLLPVNLPVFAHGKHNGQQFWMNDQEHPYYRRHLMFHEATHCYMQSMGGTTADVPVWYLEGMAELFATHRLGADGTPHFRVVPDSPDEFVGFGRIEMIAHDLREGQGMTLPQLAALSPGKFQQRQSAYAWSWVACLLADRNRRYSRAFQQLGRRYPDESFAAVREEVFDPLTADFTVEWTLLTRSFEYGHDFAATAIDFVPGAPLAEPMTIDIAADRGWQSTGIALAAGAPVTITAAGQVTLANDPKPWLSEPEGITIRYADGEPIGRLLGIVIGATAGDPPTRYVGEIVPIGAATTIAPQAAGTLYLRINDFPAELSDNTGGYQITIDREP